MSTDPVRLLHSVAAFGLPGALRDFPTRPLDDAVWRTLLAGVRNQRLEGHLADAVVSRALPASDRQIDEVAAAHQAAMWQVLRLERRLIEAVDVLDAAGLDSRVLKGSAYAHLCYPNPALRVFGDIDLLVRTDAFDDAVAVLDAAGFRRRWAQPRPGFDRRFGKGATLDGPDGVELDLHRTFTLGPYGLKVHLDDLFDSAAVFTVGGRQLQALAAEERFLHTCYHAALGSPSPRLVPLRDVAQQALAGREDLDSARVLDLARRWRGQAVLARAIRLAWDMLDVADVLPLSVWAERYEPSREERRALSVYVGRNRSYGAKVVASLGALPGLADKVAFLRALALPQRAFVTERGTAYRRLWRRGGRALVSRAAGD